MPFPRDTRGLTRRDVLARTGGACVLLAAGGLASVAGTAAAAEPAALLPRHEATFLALAGALARDPAAGVADREPAVLLERLRAFHSEGDEAARAHVVAQLDRLRAAPAGGDLVALEPEAALAQLRAWARAGDPAAAVPDPRRLLAATAVELVAAAAGSEGRERAYALDAVAA